MNDPLEKFRTICRDHGLRLTKQKEAIFQLLVKDKSHPRAEDLYVQLKKEFPRASLATVYDNLRKFKKLKLVREVACGESCSRFEARLDAHHHIMNSKTGEITDVELDEAEEIPIPKALQNKAIKEIQITYVL